MPAGVLRGVEEHLGSADGRPVRVTAAAPIGGGCVNTCARIETDRGAVLFLKWNDEAPAQMFEAEADGLRALRAAGGKHGLRVPDVLAVGAREESDWLLLEYVERGAGGRGYGEALGTALAGLHGDGRVQPTRASGIEPGGNTLAYGWHRANFIGPLPQANPLTDDWADFWRDARLAPQVALAYERVRLSRDDRLMLDRLLEHAGDALTGSEADGPSLLHGDLWSGNVYPDANGRPVLIDPAVYVGHREVDIAMSELFGGFPPGFLEAYHEAAPLDERYRRIRRPLYQLYYLMVHVNLFGESYLGGVRGAVKDVLEAL